MMLHIQSLLLQSFRHKIEQMSLRYLLLDIVSKFLRTNNQLLVAVCVAIRIPVPISIHRVFRLRNNRFRIPTSSTANRGIRKDISANDYARDFLVVGVSYNEAFGF